MDMNTIVRAQWDRLLAVGLIVLGGVALLVGWLGISGSALSYKQLPYIISGGLFGIALIGIGLTVYLSADLRDEWRKLDALEDALNAATARLTSGDDEENSAGATSSPVAARTRSTSRPRSRAVETTAQ
jgi:hypothetical protein